MSHTSGPWEADATHCRTAINSKATANSVQKHIAMVNITRNFEYEITREEHEANAKLIAAAPDLLEAAEATIESDPCSDCGGLTMSDSASCETCWVTKLKAAIKKAEGTETINLGNAG